MPTPITFRNVNIKTGADSAALGGVAEGFGRSAIQGLDIFSDQMRERVTREDELLTNEAIATALRGGPQVSGNRRVDATALQAAVQSKGTFEEAQQTSDLTQTGLQLGIEADQFTAEHREEVFALDKRATEIGLSADESTIARNKFQTSVDKYDFERSKKLNALDDTQRANVQALDSAEQGLEDQFTQQLLQGTANPSQDQINEARVQARAQVQGPQGRQALRQELVRLGASEEAWKASSGGRRDALAEASEIALQQAAEERRQTRIETGDQFALDIKSGNFSRGVADPDGNIRAGTEAELKAQKIGNPGVAIQRLNANGVNVRDFDDDDHELVEQVRDAFPNTSMFVPVVKGYVDERGNLDQKKLRTALATGQRDILLAQANLNTVSKLGGGTGRTFGGGGGQEPGLRTPASVVHASSTPEQAEADLQQLASDIKTSMDARLDKLNQVQTDDKRVQALIDQFRGIFTSGKDPGKVDANTGSFFRGATFGASDKPLTTKEMQKKFKSFDNWIKRVEGKGKPTSTQRTDLLLQRILNSAQ